MGRPDGKVTSFFCLVFLLLVFFFCKLNESLMMIL